MKGGFGMFIQLYKKYEKQDGDKSAFLVGEKFDSIADALNERDRLNKEVKKVMAKNLVADKRDEFLEKGVTLKELRNAAKKAVAEMNDPIEVLVWRYEINEAGMKRVDEMYKQFVDPDSDVPKGSIHKELERRKNSGEYVAWPVKPEIQHVKIVGLFNGHDAHIDVDEEEYFDFKVVLNLDGVIA